MALTCTGFRASTPISINEGMNCTTDPQEWMITFFPRLDAAHQLTNIREDHLAVQRRRDQAGLLAAQVVGQKHGVDRIADGLQEGLRPPQVGPMELAQHGMGQAAVGQQVDEELLEAAQQWPALQVVHSPQGHHRPVGRLVLLPGALGKRIERLVVDV